MIEHDYKNLYGLQIKERETFHYPPFCNLIEVRLRALDTSILYEASEHLKTEFQNLFGSRVLGPESPVVARVKDYFIKCFVIKVEKKGAYAKAKELLKACLIDFSVKYKNVKVNVDVDV